MFTISPISSQFDDRIQQIIDSKTKPLGALGDLETLAKQIARVRFHNTTPFSPLFLTKPHLSVFAGDHGIASQGVSIAPSEVTAQMVANFTSGGAAINVFCRQFGWQLQVVDAGMLHPAAPELGVIDQRLGAGTQSFHEAPAMTVAQVELGFSLARQHIAAIAETGCDLIAFGEMGIGNTSAASAIMAALMALPASETVGRGTGVSDEVVQRKQQLIEQALQLHHESLDDPLQILACVGGFEIAQITGAMLAAAEQKMLILVDGFISTAAAMLAFSIDANIRDYMIFAHCSGEQGHQKMLDWLQARPLLHLGLRLGEGTGAAIALPLLESAIAFYNEMASFEQAEVTNVV